MGKKGLEKIDYEELEGVEEVDSKERTGKNEKKEKSKVGKIIDNIISVIILIVCLVGLAYSGSKLYKWVLNNINSNKVINQVESIAGVGNYDDSTSDVEFGIDFEALCAYNGDVVGWIKVPGTGINYALVQGDSNDKYLRHSIDLTWNEFGWPFLDYRNAPDFTDKNTVLYGHNIVSGLMFADCANIYNGMLGDDVTIYIYRKDYKLLTYKVFSAYVYPPEMYYLSTSFASNESYGNYLNTITGRSERGFRASAGVDDTIITLSTCTSDAKNRIVVHAKLVSITDMPR